MSVRAVVPVGENVAEHVADAVVPLKVHGEVVNVPVPLLVNATVPVAVVGVADVSVTVAVHVVDEPRATFEGLQETLVVVDAANGKALTV